MSDSICSILSDYHEPTSPISSVVSLRTQSTDNILEHRETDASSQVLSGQTSTLEANVDITNLKARTTDLEIQLKELNYKYENETSTYQSQLTHKNSLIDTLRVKSQRLDFAQKEAILFLSKPLEKYDTSLSSSCSLNSTTQNPENPETAAPAKVEVSNKFEKEVIECLRFALKYLKDAQNATSIKELKRLNTATSTGSGEGEYTSPGDDNIPLLLLQEYRESKKTVVQEPKPIDDAELKQTSVSTSPAVSFNSSKRPSVVASAQKTLAGLQSPLDDDDGDLSSGDKSRSATRMPPPCANCRGHLLKVDKQADQIKELKEEIRKLNMFISEEAVIKEQISVAKTILETEIEELTAQLFDQANKMVVEEAKMREELEVANRGLKGKLEETIKQFKQRDEELKELREMLITSARKRASFSSKSRPDVGSSCDSLHSSIHIDGNQFAEFQQFLKLVTTTKESKDNPILGLIIGDANSKVLGSGFVKKIFVEDVEPCLFPASAFSSPGKELLKSVSLFRRKMLDAVVNNTCEIRHYLDVPGDKEKEKDKPIPKVKCMLCGVVGECEFKIRFNSQFTSVPSPSSIDSPTAESPSPTANSQSSVPSTTSSISTITSFFSSDEWQPLNRFCKERIVAVCEFYAWLNSLRQPTATEKKNVAGVGGGSQPILATFRHCAWLRRRMAEARFNAVSLLNDGRTHTIKNVSEVKDTLTGNVVFVH
ncbi:hypothetical protein BKA69DRAFT_1120738 [Paraphysoderma sedebokerense]|nr:hypothetical protein BKA69DRAFT_1120738 [Paraphysoderma sedebokerense]